MLGVLGVLGRGRLLSLPMHLLGLLLLLLLLLLLHLCVIGHWGAGGELGSLHHRAVARNGGGGSSSLRLRVGHGTA